LLVNGTLPSAVPLNLDLYANLYGCESKHMPSISYVRHCRTLVQIVGDGIIGINYAGNPNWKQCFFDATTRRHIPFQVVIIGLMSDGKLDPVIVSPHIFHGR